MCYQDGTKKVWPLGCHRGNGFFITITHAHAMYVCVSSTTAWRGGTSNVGNKSKMGALPWAMARAPSDEEVFLIKQHKTRPRWVCDIQYYGIFPISQIYYLIKVRLETHGL